jgi:hypothetical protein
MAAKKTIYQQLGELSDMVNNPEMAKWAERFDDGAHGATAAARHIRVNLSAVQKVAKALRAEILVRKAILEKKSKK